MYRALHPADYAVFALTIVASLLVGVYHAFSGGRQRSTNEFVMGNRRMRSLPVAMSLVASMLSAVTVLGISAEVYIYGYGFWFAFLADGIATAFVCVVNVPLFHRIQVTSAFEYLELRFKSSLLRKIGSLLSILSNILHLGVILYAPAVILDAVIGFEVWASILLTSLTAIIYTTIGGFKAVVWTDTFQFVLMLLGMLMAIIKGLVHVGGLSEFFYLVTSGQRVHVPSFSLDPKLRMSFWVAVLGGTANWLELSFQQISVQRICSTKSQADARRMIIFSGIGTILLGSLSVLMGLTAYAYYVSIKCDPLQAKLIGGANEVTPALVMDVLGDLPGLPGLFLACICSASLSSLSSGLSALSACLWVDFVQPLMPQASDPKAACITKLLIVLVGVVATCASFIVMQIGGTLIQLVISFRSAFSGPLMGVFLLGAFVPFSNYKGALLSAVISISMLLWLSLGGVIHGVKHPRLLPGPTDKCWANESISENFTYIMNNHMSNTSELYSTDGDGFEHWTDAMPMDLGSTISPNTHSDLTTSSNSSSVYLFSYMYYNMLGLVVVLVLGTLFSVLTGRVRLKEEEYHYLAPCVERLYRKYQARKIRRYAAAETGNTSSALPLREIVEAEISKQGRKEPPRNCTTSNGGKAVL